MKINDEYLQGAVDLLLHLRERVTRDTENISIAQCALLLQGSYWFLDAFNAINIEGL